MTAPFIPLEVAQRIGRQLCEARGVTLVLPGEVYRTLVVYLLAGVYALASAALGHQVGWSLDAVRSGLSITLPGAGPALKVVRRIPKVGAYLARWLEGERRTQVVMSPAACENGGRFLTTLVHELLHAERIARGGLPWCLLILLSKEAMAGSEGPSYGQSLLGQVYFEGLTPEAARDRCYRSLAGYDLDEDARLLAQDIIDVAYRTAQHGGVTTGALADAIRALQAEGVLGLPELP